MASKLLENSKKDSNLKQKKNSQKTSVPETGKNQTPSICGEKIFKEKTHFKCFTTKAPCLEYIKNQKKILYLFCEDVDDGGKKQFYALDYETIFKLSYMKKFSLY